MKTKNKNSLPQRARKIFIIVPGMSERQVLPYLLKLCNVSARVVESKFIAFENSVVVVSNAIHKQVRAGLESNCQKTILIFDHESFPICPGEFASQVRTRIAQEVAGVTPENFAVICANHKLENWILAAPQVFKSELFKKDLSKRIKHRSDCQDAEAIISEAMGKNRNYDKVRHLSSIVRYIKSIDATMRRRSPSLDKFLREVGV
ncbi:MAG: DUF4276 family protein [bacterium]